MEYIVNWYDMPRRFRDAMWPYFDVTGESHPELLNLALVNYNCVYHKNTAIFESEAHYTWFLMRWA